VRYRTEWTVRMEHNQICGKTYLDNQHESPPVQAGAEKKSDGGDMNRNFIAGSLKQFRGKLKEQWSELTNDQLGVAAARRCQIAGRAQAQYGMAQQESAYQLKDFRNRNRNWRLSNQQVL
jgi:uncharacterized protein YjbJ (UPF0337 family)